MNIRRKSAPRRWGIALAFVWLHLFFAVRASLPQAVFCHKAGGRTAVEFDTGDGECQCEECEHCRARRLAPRAGAAGPALEPCRCRHEVIFSDAGHPSLRLPERPSFLDSAAAVAERRFEWPPALLRACPLYGPVADRSPGPADEGSALLRC